MRSPQAGWSTTIVYLVSLLVVLSMVCGLVSSIISEGSRPVYRTPTAASPTTTRTPPPPAITVAPGTSVASTAVPSTATPLPAPVGAPSPVPLPGR